MIEPGSPQAHFNATVVANRHLNDSLFVLEVRTDGPKPVQEPGQFVSIGLPARTPEQAGRDGLVKRPYSIASAPSADLFEFYVRLVPEGALTPSLQALQAGDRMWVDERCVGKFTLAGLPESPAPSERNLVLVATGTGLAPFISMLREFGAARASGSPQALWNRFVIVKGVRLFEDLGYAEELHEWERRCDWFRFVPLCSREPAGSSFAGLRGRVGYALEADVFARLTGFELSPHNCQVMLCGNPQMIDEVEGDLLARGFARHRKKEPGQLHLERYW